MSKAIYRTLSNEEALKEYGRSSFVFVGGTELILEQVPESNDAPDHEQVGTDEDNNPPSDKNVQGARNLLPVCCPPRVHSGAFPCVFSARHETR